MAETVYFGTDEIRMSGGKFRTTRRYARAVASSPLLHIPREQTVVMAGKGGVNVGRLDAMRFAIGSYSVDIYGGTPDTDYSGYTPAAQGVTL